MKGEGKTILFKKILSISGVFILLSLLFFTGGTSIGVAVLSGVLLSSVFIVSSAWVLDTFGGAESSLFMNVFFFSTAIRFVLILILFAVLIGVTKINEIYFTVSFIISYLCQSVTEMIFINKILQKSSN
ncbi:MAG: hypothetical protein WD059_13720 [Balneolaceae bacterium]